MLRRICLVRERRRSTESYYFLAHSPDNSFLGFAVPRQSKDSRTGLNRPNTRGAALVYGKDPFFWKVSMACKNILIIT